MKTPMLKRRLNPFLLATTILVLSILASLSVLWQGNLAEVQKERNNLSETLDQRNHTINELQSENQNLSEEISSLKEDVNTYTNERKLLKSRIDDLNSTVDNLENRIDDLRSDNNELQDQIDGINGTLEFICRNNETYIENGEGLCNSHGHPYEGSE